MENKWDTKPWKKVANKWLGSKDKWQNNPADSSSQPQPVEHSYVNTEIPSLPAYRVDVRINFSVISGGIHILCVVKYDFNNAQVKVRYFIQGGRGLVENNWRSPRGLESYFEDVNFSVFGGYVWTFYENLTDLQNNTNGLVGTWEMGYRARPQKLWVQFVNTAPDPIIGFQHKLDFTNFYVLYNTNESGNSIFVMAGDINKLIDWGLDGLIYFQQVRLEIVGNTSRSDTADNNLILSEKRAKDMQVKLEERLMAKLSNGEIFQNQFDSAISRITLTFAGESNASGPEDSDFEVDRNVQVKFSYIIY